jgi:hypothetical protein
MALFVEYEKEAAEKRARERGVTVEELERIEQEEDAKAYHEFYEAHGYAPDDPYPPVYN